MLTVLVGLAIQTSPWVKTLPNKSVVKLVAISDIANKQSWDPLGRPMPFLTKSYIYEDAAKPKSKKALAAIVTIDHVAGSELPTVVMRGDSVPTYGGMVGYYDDFHPIQPYQAIGTFNLPMGKSKMDLTVMCADGPWKVSGSQSRGIKKTSGVKFNPLVLLQKKTSDSGGDAYQVDIKIPKELRDGKTAYRLIAYDAGGKKLEDAGTATQPGEKGASRFWFRTGRKALGRIDIETRPFETVVFKSVALKIKR